MISVMTATDTAIPCDIVLLPDTGQAKQAAHCSELLSRQGSLFTIDNQNFFAHASMYMFQMSADKQDECIAVLQKIAQAAAIQTLSQNGYSYQDTGFGKGYVDIAYSRNDKADRLQQTIVDLFNPLRAGMRENDKAKMVDATGIKLENLQKYGYPAIGELFRPHITITKFPQDIEPDLNVLPDPTIFTGVFTKLGLFEMGDNGTCIRCIASFDLQR
jgi:hypothetical protein